MEKRNEEISEKAVSKKYDYDLYEEIRIEYFLAPLLNQDPRMSILLDAGYKLNNIIIPGFNDIGPNGQAIFILRKVKNNG